MDGFGPPQVLKGGKGDWGVYRFNDLGFDIELNGKPTPAKRDPRENRRPGKWAVYNVDNSPYGLQIFAGKYPLRLKPTLDEEADDWAKAAKGYENDPPLRVERTNIVLGGRKAIRLQWSYMLESESVTIEAYVIEDPMLMLTLMAGYPSKMTNAVRPEIDRTMRTLRFHSR